VLVNEMRMEDPEALAEPFAVTTRYRRDRYGKLLRIPVLARTTATRWTTMATPSSSNQARYSTGAILLTG
jgi:hypothetical protein